MIKELTMLPLHINVQNQNVLIVGGGSIALRRLQLFLEEDAHVTVVSPEVVEEIENLARSNQLIWKKKKIEVSDLSQAFIIIAATNDHQINEWVAKQVAPTQLINVASNAEQGNVIVPKSIQKGRLTLSVSTNGASPKLAKQICEQISHQFDESFIKELDIMYEKRQENKKNKGK
ncbi:NAD(P)-dependent oxidoreductase [Metabacillus litoralis]|uniref:NAD(P)-dependent oxidoreductase n=1 Tax=Metabacillus litoralis TaxID=152268 RepID=UPI001CFE7FCC|nr:NAD(P)-dependent oxidoreductase [Metabacillus litoralis]